MSGEEEVIVIGGGTKPRAAAEVTVKPQGLAHIRDVVKSYSTWVLAVIVAGPDLYQGATSLGMLSDESMPDTVKWSVRALGGIGLLVKFISQRKPTA